MKFRQVEEKDWKKGDYRMFAQIKTDTSFLERKFQIKFDKTFVDGMGNAKYAFFETENGCYFVIDEYGSNSVNNSTQIHLLNDIENLANDLDEVLEALELTTEDLMWVELNLKFSPHKLWRQDDNGHKFLIETFSCKADAARAKREFENRKHKQIYWLEKSVEQ